MADQQGDSFIQLVNANLGIARKICRLYCDNPDGRDDLLQEMMFQLWRAFPAFHGHSKFSTWMYRVCLNTALTYRRNNRNTKKESISQSHHEIPDRPPEHQEESIAMLFKAIAGLSPVNKAIVLLYLDNMSYEEIASITGLSRSNVSVRLVRLKKERVVLFLPFTAMLMSKFKQIALINPNTSNKEGVLPLFHYVERRRVLLQSFYSFKKRYEILLIPLATAIGVFLTFRLYVPGGVLAHPGAAIVAFVITISSCILAIRSENRKNFDRPIRELDKILDDFRRDG